MTGKNVGFHAIRRKNYKTKLSATQIIALVFFCIILAGTVLLMLPISSTGKPASFLDALFTATSATCVTGLVVGDTGTIWTGFGQTVIITMIEIGGLGFMSAAAMMVFLFRKKMGLRQRMVVAQALSLEDMDSVVHIQKLVLGGSLAIQALAATVLTLRFLPRYGLATALKWGGFHAISAFCNAGFDIFGNNDSVASFRSDPVVMITLMVLVVVGGLGFLVWEDIAQRRKGRRFSVYTKLVLWTTGALLVLGAVMTMALEWNNPQTLGAMSPGEKILNACFQSVTLRTAGFASFSQAGLTEASKGFSIILMLIGGSSGSTAGGLKTVTFLVLVLFVISRIRGVQTVNVFKRTVPKQKILDALTVTAILAGLAFAGTIVICATSPVSFADGLFETASALGTVGITADVTGKLHVIARIMIIVFMFFGRVGVLTLSMGFLTADKAQQRYTYAETNLLIG